MTTNGETKLIGILSTGKEGYAEFERVYPKKSWILQTIEPKKSKNTNTKA